MQLQALKDKFDSLDANGDKALNKNELANIFSCQNLTQEEKGLLMKGVDGDDDGFVTYTEFTPTFVEFDIDQNTEFSGDEYDLVKKRIEELEKQTEINAQYDILKDLTSTEEEKKQAEHNIEIFKTQRNIIFGEMQVKKKDILISDKELKIQEIQDFIDSNTLLEFEEAKKLKEINMLNVEKDLLLLEKDVAQQKVDLNNISLLILNKEYEKENETDPEVLTEIQKDLDVYAQQKIKNDNELSIAEREIELYHKQSKIDNRESLLNKFFVPEPVKDLARKDLESLNDEKALSNQRIDLYNKIVILSETRAELIEKIYARDTSEDPQEIAELQELIDQLNETEDLQQLQATIASMKVELINKQIKLKEVIPRSHISPFDEVRAELEQEITDLSQEITDLESQLS